MLNNNSHIYLRINLHSSVCLSYKLKNVDSLIYLPSIAKTKMTVDLAHILLFYTLIRNPMYLSVIQAMLQSLDSEFRFTQLLNNRQQAI